MLHHVRLLMGLALGLILAWLGVMALRNGRLPLSDTTRSTRPFRFHGYALLLLGCGGAVSFLTVKQLLSGPEPAAPDRCAEFDSAFECFMALDFQSLFGLLLLLGGSVGAGLVQLYQRRALAKLMKTVERNDRP